MNHPAPLITLHIGRFRGTAMLATQLLLFSLAASTARALDVVRENDTWRVKWQDGTYTPCENNIFRAIEKAVSVLPNDRTSKYTIRILAGAGSTYTVAGGPANLRSEGNFILDCGGANGTRFDLTSGAFINAHNAHNSEVRNLTVVGKTTAITVFFKNSNNVRFENIKVMTPGGSIGLRPEGTWQTNSYARNTVVAGNCYFSGMSGGNHGIETMSLDGFTIAGTVTTRNTGGAGVLLNKTRNAHLHRVDAEYASYDPANQHNYAALRLANDCADDRGVDGGISVNYLIARYCGRGFVIVTSQTRAGVYVGNVDIVGSANWGIIYTTGDAPNAPSVNNVRINSGRSINNAWDGLLVGQAFNCNFQDLSLTGNGATGLTIDGRSRNLALIRVNVDSNAKPSVFSWASITNAMGSDLTN